MKIPKNKQFVFWKYDQFPYILGAEVTEINEAGKMYVASYQGWVCDNNLGTTDLETGEKLLIALQKLKIRHSDQINHVNGFFREILLENIKDKIKSPFEK